MVQIGARQLESKLWSNIWPNLAQYCAKKAHQTSKVTNLSSWWLKSYIWCEFEKNSLKNKPIMSYLSQMSQGIGLTTIIVGDFNFDKSETNALTAFLNKRQFIQVVEWPTHKEGRTIDHCYVSKNTKVQVTRHSPYYSDHNGLCIQFEHFPWC